MSMGTNKDPEETQLKIGNAATWGLHDKTEVR